LQLNDLQASGTNNNAYISFQSNVINNAEWEIFVKIDAATSSSNYVRYYLASDQADLSGSLKGFFIMIGNTADEISLYKQSGVTRTKIIDGEDGRTASSKVEICVKATRDEYGNWELFSRLLSEDDYKQEGNCLEPDVFQSNYAGFFVQYSSGNKDKYFLDNCRISGEPNKKSYEIQADEILFSELMVKPSPAVNLPEYEYIELYNVTPYRINLSGFQLADNSRKYTIEDCIMEPYAYLLLCSESRLDAFSAIENVKGMKNIPSLTDSGKLLWLEDAEGNLISWVEYSKNWYADEFKSGGGWSLECIDLSNISNQSDNWSAANNENGGSPGKVNSIAMHNPDILQPTIKDIAIVSEHSVEVFFSEPMNIVSLKQLSNYSVYGLTVVNAETAFPKGESVILYFDRAIEERSVYELTLSNIFDKAGNLLNKETARFALPEDMELLDIVINEVLFNPQSDGVKYVELYNRSTKTLDISELIITNRRNGELQTGSLLSSARSLLFSGEYLLLTTNLDIVCQQFQCGENGKKINISPFPSYPSAEGTVVLAHRDSRIIDEFSYSEKMHHTMVKNTKGVSLERISPNAETQNQDNWHSASFTSGYGTPAYQNSQFSSNSETISKEVWLETEDFSPNNDGTSDFLNIHYSLDKNGYTGNFYIFDSLGKRVRTLANNVLLDTEGVMRWKGENDNGQICDIGIYVLYVEFVHKDGKTKRHKMPCVIYGE
jgi:hypothetical protein